MDFARWLTAWLKRHSLKEPASRHRWHYTTEVMAKVQALAPASRLETMARRNHVVWGWPRLALTFATAAAGVAIAVVALNHSTRQLAKRITQESQLLAELGEPVSGSVGGEDVESLANEMETMDALVLAESPQSDEAWIQQTMQLLNQLGEDAPDEATSSPSKSDTASDEWLQELEMLEQTDLAASS